MKNDARYVETIIPTRQIDNIQELRAAFEKHISPSVLENYRLPVKDKRVTVIVGLSGGADSTVLALFSALYLAPHYPNIEFLFTDTKDEPKSCYETLRKIEQLTGIKLTRLVPEMGLFEKIDDYNGFLPNTKARWCTKELKITPLISYLKGKTREHGYINLAGIRWDESDRDGVQFQHSMENDAKSAYPFIDLHMTKAMVFDILDKTLGIPSTYQYRSRSGCGSCFFQRNSEIIGMLHHDRAAYLRTESKEKLTIDDMERWNSMPVTLAEIGIRPYYPVPAFVDIRKPERLPNKAPGAVRKTKPTPNMDMFEHETREEDQYQDLYTAFALFVNPVLSHFGGREFTPGVYWQEFVTFSTSLKGLKSSLGNYYKHKLTTPMPHTDVEDMKIVISQLRFPAGAIDVAPPSKDSFTWKSKVSYLQLRNLVTHCQSVLERADLKRRLIDTVNLLKTAQNNDIAMDAYEVFESLKEQCKTTPKAQGKVIWEGLYTPTKTVATEVQLMLDGVSVDTKIKVPKVGLEFDEVPRACISCSI